MQLHVRYVDVQVHMIFLALDIITDRALFNVCKPTARVECLPAQEEKAFKHHHCAGDSPMSATFGLLLVDLELLYFD